MQAKHPDVKEQEKPSGLKTEWTQSLWLQIWVQRAQFPLHGRKYVDSYRWRPDWSSAEINCNHPMKRNFEKQKSSCKCIYSTSADTQCKKKQKSKLLHSSCTLNSATVTPETTLHKVHFNILPLSNPGNLPTSRECIYNPLQPHFQ